MIFIDRRKLLAGSATLAAGLLLYGQRDHLRAISDRVLGGRSESGPREAGVTGDPAPELLGLLWRLFQRITVHWDLSGHVDLDAHAFAQLIGEKTAQVPSYLTEYREAGALLAELEATGGPDAFDVLFTPGALREFTRLGRLQKFVLGEFIEWQLAYGGFRAFGYRNYRGFAGGPLSGAAELPYRAR